MLGYIIYGVICLIDLAGIFYLLTMVDFKVKR